MPTEKTNKTNKQTKQTNKTNKQNKQNKTNKQPEPKANTKQKTTTNHKTKKAG